MIEKAYGVSEMKGIIDIHAHILPGLDDGAKTMEEAVEAAAMAREQGIDAVIVTPHYNPMHPITPEQVRGAIEGLKSELSKKAIDLEIYEGEECLYHNGLVDLRDRGKVLTLAGSPYVLVEFPPEAGFSEILKGLRKLQRNGYLPILAHYERYVRLQNKQTVAALKRRGILLQMNFDTLQRVYGRIFKHNPFKKDVLKGYVDFFGSDCHGAQYRKYFIVPSLEWMKKALSEERYLKLLSENPQMILNASRKSLQS